MTIIGRHFEQKQLEKIYQSTSSEFVAVYGRRRVGKTYLIRRFFESKDCIFFQTAGIHKGVLKRQLDKFKNEIEAAFYKNKSGTKLQNFNNWHTALQALTDAIDLIADQKQIIIFMDEVPWMATHKSGLIEAIDYYWNRYWSDHGRIKLILCGSAASWMIKNILQDTGGLHNRITLKLRIEPFNLAETKNYLEYKGIKYNIDQLLTLYMCLGGIAFYLNFIEKGLSAIQNIDNICFQNNGALHDEFRQLFTSLFKHHHLHKELITFIATKRYGVSRQTIENKLNLKGGRLTHRLRELEEAGFIQVFLPHDNNRGTYYKIIDEYSLFYLTWIAPKSPTRLVDNLGDQYWAILAGQPTWHAWAGYAFESICFKHLKFIRQCLKIPSGSKTDSWRYYGSEEQPGAQIDLVFDRPDGIINLCEIKYSKSPFIIDKDYAKVLLQREATYCLVNNTTKQVFHSFITACKLKENQYSKEIVSSNVTIEDILNMAQAASSMHLVSTD